MKHLFTLMAFAMLLSNIYAQEGTHTLQHIAPEDATATPNYWGQTMQGVPLWGYHAGHNAFGDEAFGEKYEISGIGTVVGVMAYIGGTGTSTWQASMTVNGVAPSGMPSDALASHPLTISELVTDGVTPTVVTFNNPVAVTDEFFVIFDLDDYSHELQMLDTLVLMMGPDGSRPASDDVFGRNVIRWHGHGAPNWKDFQTENFTNWSTHFAIYPIMEGEALSTNSDFLSQAELSMFPVPFQHELNLRFEARESREMFVRVFSTDGKLLRTERQMVVQGDNLVQLQLSDLPSGAYVVALEAGDFRVARTVSK